jgi:outer membrane protein assembly factor BamB
VETADTTTSCRFLPRLVAVLLLSMTTLAAQDVPLPPMPTVEAGPPAFLLTPPSAIRWNVPIAAAPMHPPLIAGDVVFVTFLPGILAAHDLQDGRELWRATLNPDHAVAADGERVYVAAGDAVQALRARDGTVVWRAPAGALTSAPLVKDGWVIVTPARKTMALRATDGTTVWSRDTATQRVRGTIEGDTLVLPMTNGHLDALDLKTGTPKWTQTLGGIPAESLVLGTRIYLGATDKYFYCVDLDTGEIEWRYRVGAVVRGRAASDGERVYFVALDNLVRAHDRDDGAQRWQHGLPFRALSGPAVANGVVLIAGGVTDVRLLNAVTGADAGKIAFPERLVTAPSVGDLSGTLVVAAITGGLAESWKVILASYGSPSASR